MTKTKKRATVQGDNHKEKDDQDQEGGDRAQGDYHQGRDNQD